MNRVAVISKWAYQDALEWFFSRAFQRLGWTVTESNLAQYLPEMALPDADLSLNVKAAWVPPERLSGIKALYYPDLTTRFPGTFRCCQPEKYDFVFLPHNEPIVDKKRIFHLPVGYDPEWHTPESTSRHEGSITASFIGTWRQERAWLQMNPRVFIWGDSWGGGIRPVYGKERRAIVARSKVNLNVHYPGETENMRLYELLALKAFQLSDLPGPFTPGEHLALYTNPNDAFAKVKYYADHEEEREAIARAGHEAVKPHTYDARMTQLLKVVGL